MRIFSNLRGTKGFITAYNRMLRFRDMIQEAAQQRAKILTFWQKHGLEATKEAFGISRATLYRWQKKLQQGRGRLEFLNKGSTIPKNKRKRIIDCRITDFIISQRELYPRLGKEKIRALMMAENITAPSSSTVGRIINGLKKQGKLPQNTRLSLSGRTGRLLERKPRKFGKKLRRKDYRPEKEGDLVQLDTVVKFINGLRRYIVTAIDLKSDFAFAYGYVNASSSTTKDFFQKLESVAPFPIERIQTDNGSEFESHFRDYAEQKRIIHFHNYSRCPKMNAHIERFNRTIQEEFINYRKQILAYDLNVFNQRLIDWLLWYNTKRPHWSLGLISPLRYICNQLPAKESQMLWTDT